MRTFYTILFVGICLFYGCQETIDFPTIEEEALVVLNNPIRFDQLAVGQKSTYISIQHDYENDLFCIPNSDTLFVEIIAKDTSGYLVQEIINTPNATPFFFYLKYESRQVVRDTVDNEPSIREYDELIAIKSEPVDAHSHQRSHLFRRLGTKFYLNTLPQKTLINQEVASICEVFFLPNMENDPLPNRDGAHHSELGITKKYMYEGNCYGDLLVATHDYGYQVDAFNYNYGYSLTHGLVFSGAFRGIFVDGAPQVWHIIPN